MSEIKILGNDPMRYIYDTEMLEKHNLPVPDALVVREWTLEELLDTLDVHSVAASGCAEAAETLRKKLYCTELSAEDIKTKSQKYIKYKLYEKEYKAQLDAKKDYYIALDGIRGAIRYAVAQRLNEVAPAIFQKYKGKPAGPKTRSKVRAELERAFGVDTVSLYEGGDMMHVSFSPFSRYEVWLDKSLTDSDNKFTGEFGVHVPYDEFEGKYPMNWMQWANHVKLANEAIQAEFDEFVAKHSKLATALKIGDVAMKRTYSWNLKEER